MLLVSRSDFTFSLLSDHIVRLGPLEIRGFSPRICRRGARALATCPQNGFQLQGALSRVPSMSVANVTPRQNSCSHSPRRSLPRTMKVLSPRHSLPGTRSHLAISFSASRVHQRSSLDVALMSFPALTSHCSSPTPRVNASSRSRSSGPHRVAVCSSLRVVWFHVMLYPRKSTHIRKSLTHSSIA